jgi:hypothetical protein
LELLPLTTAVEAEQHLWGGLSVNSKYLKLSFTLNILVLMRKRVTGNIADADGRNAWWCVHDFQQRIY